MVVIVAVELDQHTRVCVTEKVEVHSHHLSAALNFMYRDNDPPGLRHTASHLKAANARQLREDVIANISTRAPSQSMPTRPLAPTTVNRSRPLPPPTNSHSTRDTAIVLSEGSETDDSDIQIISESLVKRDTVTPHEDRAASSVSGRGNRKPASARSITAISDDEDQKPVVTERYGRPGSKTNPLAPGTPSVRKRKRKPESVSASAIEDARPPKSLKRAHTLAYIPTRREPPMRMSIASSMAMPKRMLSNPTHIKKEPEIIDLVESDDDVDMPRAHDVLDKQDVKEEEESDPEDDYDAFWEDPIEVEEPAENYEEPTPIAEPDLSLGGMFQSMHLGRGHVPRRKITFEGWHGTVESKLDRWYELPRSQPRARFREQRPSLVEAVGFDRLTEKRRVKQSGGSINMILQHNGRVVVCSATPGGESSNASEPDPYNRAGTLISWSQVETMANPADVVDLEQQQLGQAENVPHNTVKCIAYDPYSNVLAASSGKVVHTWDYDSELDSYEVKDIYRYKYRNKSVTPLQVIFKPDEAGVLGVGERSLTVHRVNSDSQHSFSLTPEGQEPFHTVGSFVWGADSLLFASTEPTMDQKAPNPHKFCGFHGAFDLNSRDKLPLFDLETSPSGYGEAGDAMCIDDCGSLVALATQNETKNTLRLYDVRRRDGRARRTIQLESFSDKLREVTASLSVPTVCTLRSAGESDNHAHIYDTRMFKKHDLRDRDPYRLLADFKHLPGEDFGVTSAQEREKTDCGITGMHWAESRDLKRNALVTSGDDGHIRLWNPDHSNQNGHYIATTDADVATFVVGIGV
ncbi:unnamed protein product [Mycena citricolor]|uniref:WD40 repeat-like protein n=1 Tax=Mycena citricolor TaxID=2018698 RepID=A0AAD2Q1Z0_9AGAR|nr:unnamed protein product [Mycena citricolor]